MSTLRIAFAGTPDFAAAHLEHLLSLKLEIVAVLTQPDRRSGRGKKATPSPVKALALEAGLPVMQPQTLRDDEAAAAVAALDLDVLVVVAYGLILPQKVLDLPRYGCLNVHGSLLPRWRGAAPIQRAVEAGDPVSGVTIMQMDAGLDTGPMLAKGICEIPPLATSGDLYGLLAESGPRLLGEVLSDLPSFLEGAVAQDDELASHAAKLTKEEAVIDWNTDATVLARKIRAFNPSPGCFTTLGGERLKIWQAHPAPSSNAVAPGTILPSEGKTIAIRCGEGALVLDTLQLPGGKALSAAEMLRGKADRFSTGARLGIDPSP
ncbi:MAG: methionyl-tRNA formyltransferase [Pseudomonadota bacterium]